MTTYQSLLDLYREKGDHFRFKGSRPGESETTRINELALVGDAFLKLEVVSALVKLKFTNSQITTAISSVLSNFALKEWAVLSGIIVSRTAGTHASGTLLEALVGYLVIARDNENGKELYNRYCFALKSLVDNLVEQSTLIINESWDTDDLFN